MNTKQIIIDQRRGVDLAIEAAKSIPQLAEMLGISRQAIYKWRRIPAERLQDVAIMTGVPAKILRPDLYRRPE